MADQGVCPVRCSWPTTELLSSGLDGRGSEALSDNHAAAPPRASDATNQKAAVRRFLNGPTNQPQSTILSFRSIFS